MVRSSVMKRCGRDLVAKLFDGEDGLITLGAGDEVFGLQLGAAGGREVHAEVGQAFVPRAGNAHLLGAGSGVVAGERVEVFVGGLGSVEVFGDFEEHGFVMGISALLLDPDLSDAVVLPVGEEADAVAAGEDGVEVVLELVHGQVFVDDLPHLEGGLDVEGDLGDHA